AGGAAVVAEAAGDRAVRTVTGDEDRRLVAGLAAAARGAAGRVGVARVPLDDVPAVVDAARAPGRLTVDLLPALFADVADVEVPVQPVEAEAPGVAQAVVPDLVARRGIAVDEGVRRGDD